MLAITKGNSVDLSYLDDTGSDDQQLSFAGTLLSLANGGTVDLSSLDDTTVYSAGNGIVISGNTISLADTVDKVADADADST
ncbi:hypothetical protein, partial [Pelomicrobium sp. G1]|uniref:hypothetical protein n=1 Tax=Pelomicrobium sp. G1 TaxID=3452920 RepID=UPI003F777D9B